jgi:hypothetical protein
MIESRTPQEAAVLLTGVWAEQIDAELAKDYERIRRTIAWSH